MRRAYERFISFLEGYSAILIVVMLAVVLLGVFFRYFLGAALSWYDEFAGYTLVWVTMYGSVVALARGKHIGFETVQEKLPPGGQRAVEIFSTLCVLGFSVVLSVSSWSLVREMAAETAVSLPAVRMAWIYSVMPITGVLMVLVEAVRLIALLRGANIPGAPQRKALAEGQ